MKSLLGLRRHTLRLVNFNTVLLPAPPPSLSLVKTSLLARGLQWTTPPSLLILGLMLNPPTMTMERTRVTRPQLAARVATTLKQVHIVVIACKQLYTIASLALPIAWEYGKVGRVWWQRFACCSSRKFYTTRSTLCAYEGGLACLVPSPSPQLLSLAVQITRRNVIRTASDWRTGNEARVWWQRLKGDVLRAVRARCKMSPWETLYRCNSCKIFPKKNTSFYTAFNAWCMWQLFLAN